MRGELVRFAGATGTVLGGLLALISVAGMLSEPMRCWFGPGVGCSWTGYGYLLTVGVGLVAVGSYLLIRSGLLVELQGG